MNIRALAASVPQLKRGQVWCRKCGFTMSVVSGQCLQSGWPKCHGATMTIDSPEEQQHSALEARDNEEDA